MITNSETRLLRKKLLVAQGALCRQKTQMMLDTMRSDLSLGTNRTGSSSALIDLLAGAVGTTSLSSLVISLVGDSRLTRWLQNIRRTLQLSQLVVDIYQTFSRPTGEKLHPSIVRERTDEAASRH